MGGGVLAVRRATDRRRRPGLPSRPTSTRSIRCAPTGWCAASRRPPTSRLRARTRRRPSASRRSRPAGTVSVFVDLPVAVARRASPPSRRRRWVTSCRSRCAGCGGVNGVPDGEVSSYLHDGFQPGRDSRTRVPRRRFRADTVGQPAAARQRGRRDNDGAADGRGDGANPARTPGRRRPRRSRSRVARDDVACRASIDDFTAYRWYESIGPDDTDARSGYMDLSDVKLPVDINVLTCGPLPFMRHVRPDLIKRGVEPNRIRYEVFGPDLWAARIPA